MIKGICDSFMQKSSLGIMLCDSDGRFLECNNAFLKIFSLTEKKQLSSYNLNLDPNFKTLCPAKDDNDLRGIVEYNPEIGSVSGFPAEPEGGIRTIEVQIITHLSGKNKTKILQIADITEKMKLEELAKESLYRYRILVSSSLDAILMINLSPEKKMEKIIFANEAAHHKLGYRKGELLRLDAEKIFSKDSFSRFPFFMSQLGRNGKVMMDFDSVCSDGKTVPLESATHLISLKGHPVLMMICRDISRRRLMEQEMVKTEKMESFGAFAAGIAHDFNNILTAVLSNVTLCRTMTEQGSDMEEGLVSAENAVYRARDLAQQLMIFAKGGQPVFVKTDLIKLLRETADYTMADRKTVCEFNFSETHLFVNADPGQLAQVVNNLLINASQAMNENGTVRIDALRSEGDNDNKNSFIEISITDHGCGIPVHVLPKIFDPYFTTKSKGNGLGLSMVYSIIRKHGGSISVESEPGIKTVFHVRLPEAQ